jgi:hypothetical protein
VRSFFGIRIGVLFSPFDTLAQAMTAAELTEFLIAEIDAGDAAFVTNLLAAAKDKITKGGGVIAPLISASENGKAFNRELKMDAAVVAKCCRDAIAATSDDEDDQPLAATSFDFRDL